MVLKVHVKQVLNTEWLKKWMKLKTPTENQEIPSETVEKNNLPEKYLVEMKENTID